MNLDPFVCLNPDCPDHNKKKADNIKLYARYGRKQVRLLICKTCGKTFSELKGTPFWDSRLDWDRIEGIYRYLLNGNGVRATAREYSLSKNTVKRYLRLSGNHFERIQGFLLDRGVITTPNDPRLAKLMDNHNIPYPKQTSQRSSHT